MGVVQMIAMSCLHRAEASTTGSDQEAAEGKERGSSFGEAGCGENSPQEHDSGTRDDR